MLYHICLNQELFLIKQRKVLSESTYWEAGEGKVVEMVSSPHETAAQLQ